MTDRPLAPLLIIEDGELRCAALDRHACVKALVKELDAQRAALAELRAKVGRLSDPICDPMDDDAIAYNGFGCRWCRAQWGWDDTSIEYAVAKRAHPPSDCLYHDWLAAQPRPTPGAGEE